MTSIRLQPASIEAPRLAAYVNAINVEPERRLPLTEPAIIILLARAGLRLEFLSL
jgi:hypothetical protein